MKQFTKRLNLNLCPATYNWLKQEATNEGRKTGNYVRRLLDEWAKDRQEHETDRRKKNMS